MSGYKNIINCPGTEQSWLVSKIKLLKLEKKKFFLNRFISNIIDIFFFRKIFFLKDKLILIIFLKKISKILILIEKNNFF